MEEHSQNGGAGVERKGHRLDKEAAGRKEIRADENNDDVDDDDGGGGGGGRDQVLFHRRVSTPEYGALESLVLLLSKAPRLCLSEMSIRAAERADGVRCRHTSRHVMSCMGLSWLAGFEKRVLSEALCTPRQKSNETRKNGEKRRRKECQA